MKKQKLILLQGIVLCCAVSILAPWLGVHTLQLYFQFPDDFVYSWLAVAVLACIFIFPVAFIFIFKLINMERFVKPVENFTASYCVPAFFFICLCTPIFSIYYTNKLHEMGYTRCQGTPMGYSPGTGVRYVKDPASCHKKMPDMDW